MLIKNLKICMTKKNPEISVVCHRFDHTCFRNAIWWPDKPILDQKFREQICPPGDKFCPPGDKFCPPEHKIDPKFIIFGLQIHWEDKKEQFRSLIWLRGITGRSGDKILSWGTNLSPGEQICPQLKFAKCDAPITHPKVFWHQIHSEYKKEQFWPLVGLRGVAG